MTLTRAHSAKIEWDPLKKHWHVQIHVGAEVIKRPFPKLPQSAGDDELRSEAVATAKDEGYELDPAHVAIAR
jgi:hypothetical protein